MNLTRALDVALPEIPARTLAERYPCLDPGVTHREHYEDGKPIVRVYIPSNGYMYKLQPLQWQLVQLFDGKRSYEQIAELISQKNSIAYAAEDVREFAADLESTEFWYKTSQEKNILLMLQSTEERRKKLQVRSKWADLSVVVFPAFNPDKFLTWLYDYTEFIYTPWFTILTLIAFAVTFGISVSHWREIGRDTLEFYNFSHKTWADFFILYVLGMYVVAVHEFAHAHACKHYGGRVPAMGFALVYLTPAFYTDTTEGAVKGTRYQRLIISLAGIWSELMLCSIATPIWWATPPDTLLHDAAYFTMMMTGFMSLILNWNPLMKLDGYHMLCEVLGIADLKEDSTAFVSAWVRRKIWRLPVEIPYVPKRRRLGFAVYGLLSGAYSYTVLFVVARFAGNVFRNFNQDWSFVPEITVALLIFRSRIRLLVNFMKFFYLDKKDRIAAWFTVKHTLLVAAAVAVFLALPLWHDSVTGQFYLEPAKTAVVRTHVPGVVVEISAEEGKSVAEGAPLAQLRNLPLQSDVDRSHAQLLVASERANAAALHYAGYAEASKEREGMSGESRAFSAKAANLEIISPIAGTVVTPRLKDRVGGYFPEGTELLEVVDLSKMRAKIYISEYDLSKLSAGAPARLQVTGLLHKWIAQTNAIGVNATEMDARLLEPNKLKGLNPPHFYMVDLIVNNPDETLKPGMMGMARVYGRRRTLAGLCWEGLENFWSRKIW
jgi:putative peptide zinc metalloprotease protein